MSKVKHLSGILILLSFISTIYSYFFNNDMLIVSGILVWLAFLMFFKSIVNKKMIIILLSLSFIMFSISYYNSFNVDISKVFTVNQYLLTLLIGVGFLRLIASPKKDKTAHLPRGKESFIKTYLGVHLFGSVINFSSLILVADKMHKKSALCKTQIVLLTRAFSSAAYWSPFFVAFAAASTYAPNLSTPLILINGLFLAFTAFFITYLEVKKEKKFLINEFRGYPVNFESLMLPFVLALMVVLTNHYFPHIKVIVLISLFSFLLALIVLPINKGFKKTINKLKEHTFEELPKMKQEVSLFLVAGMFGISISSIFVGLGLSFPFEKFDWFIASILLAIFIVLAFIGIHPIITIAVIGDLMSNTNNTLFAITFLMAWSITVATSPFSGINMTMFSRYNINVNEVFKLNINYALKMYIVCIFCLYLVSSYLKL